MCALPPFREAGVISSQKTPSVTLNVLILNVRVRGASVQGSSRFRRFRRLNSASELFSDYGVVPEPLKGSKTRSPGRELARMIFASSFSGFCVDDRCFRASTSRDCQISPEIRRMCQPETPVFSLGPVFRCAVWIGVRRDHLPLEHHCIDIEVIIVSNREEPNIFRTVFPV